MWRMLVGFLPLSQPSGAVYPSRPILFQSGNLLFFFFPFSSFFFPPHLTKISGKAEQGHKKQTSALELGTGTCPKPSSGHGGSAQGTSRQEHAPRSRLFPGAGQPQISP